MAAPIIGLILLGPLAIIALGLILHQNKKDSTACQSSHAASLQLSTTAR